MEGGEKLAKVLTSYKHLVTLALRGGRWLAEPTAPHLCGPILQANDLIARVAGFPQQGGQRDGLEVVE